jgi:hypothetical protein
MMETTEQIQDPILADSPVPEIPQPETQEQDESVLTTGITQLWQVHCDYQTSIKHETEQFRALRNKLGKLLHRMKELLARPGRGGLWSSFLKEREIPRATADRLVQKYEQSLHPHANCLTESISEPTEDEIEKLCAKVFPKLRRVLRTQHSLYRFVELMTSTLDGVDHRMTEEGLLIVKPCQLAMSSEFSTGAIVAESPMVALAEPEVELDQELM